MSLKASSFNNDHVNFSLLESTMAQQNRSIALSETSMSHFSGSKIEIGMSHRWDTLLTRKSANDVKDFIGKDDVLNAIWSVGFEPTQKEFDVVEKEFTEHRRKNYGRKTEESDQSSYPRLVKLFSKYESKYEAVEECLLHWKFHATTPRPDNFQFLPYRTYFFNRLGQFLFPRMLPKAWTKFFLPGYTPYEISIQKVTMPLYFVSVIVFWGTVVSWVLILTGQAKTVEWSELAVCSLCSMVVCFGSQAARESSAFSIAGQRNRQQWMFRRFCLFYYSFDKERQTNGFKVFLEHLKCVAAYDLFKTQIVQPSAHSHFFSQKFVTSRFGGRLPRAQEDIELDISKSEDEHDSEHFDAKYGVFSFNLMHLLMQLIALSIAFLPNFINWANGESSILNGFDHHTGDYVVDAIIMFILAFCGQFTLQILITDAYEESQSCNKLAKFLCWTLDESSPGLAPFGLLSDSYGDNHLELKFRLDDVGKVRAFEALYEFEFSLLHSINSFHISAFEIGSVICVLATIGVLISSLFGSKVTVWNSVLFMFGSLVLLALTRIFVIIAVSYKFITKGVVRGLHLQIHYNCLSKSDDGLDKDRDFKLEQTNILLTSLATAIFEKAPMRMFGKIPLTSENVFKLGGAVLASLFTTVLRAFLAMENLKSAKEDL